MKTRCWFITTAISVALLLCGCLQATLASLPPAEVEIAWLEMYSKRAQYVEDASLLFLNRLLDPFDPEVAARFNAVDEPLPVLSSLRCATEDTHLFDSVADIEGFFKYFFLSRLFYSDLSQQWGRYYSNFSAHRSLRAVNMDELMASPSQPLFDFVTSLESEHKALALMESRFASLFQPAFLDATDEEVEAVHREFSRQQKERCLRTHLAAARDLRSVVSFVTNNTDKFVRGLCEASSSLEAADDEGDEDDWMFFLDEEEEEQEREGESEQERIARKEKRETMKRELALQREKRKEERVRAARANRWTSRAIRRFMTRLQGMPRYREINTRLYDFILYHYKEHYLVPFMDSHFCDEHRRVVHRNNTRLYRKQPTTFVVQGEEHETTVVVTEHALRESVPLDDCVKTLRSVLFVRVEKLKEKITESRMVRRSMYFAENNTDEAVQSLLSRRDLGGSFTTRDMCCLAYWDEVSRKDEEICLPHNADSAAYNVLNLMSVLAVSPETLVESRQYPSPDRTLSLTSTVERENDRYGSLNDGGMFNTETESEASFQPLGVRPSNNNALDNSVPLLSGNALVLGLGGGEFHDILLRHFPFLTVESVEVSREVVSIALHDFGMRHLICAVEEYVPKQRRYVDALPALLRERETQRRTSLRQVENELFSPIHHTQVLQHKFYHFESLYNLQHVRYEEDRDAMHTERVYNRDFVSLQNNSAFAESDFACRSKVKIIDGWQYIQQRYMEIIAEENDAKERWQSLHHSEREAEYLLVMRNVSYVDYLFVDVYDDATTSWTGDVFAGESLSQASAAISSLHLTKQLLRPFTGLAVFHLHKDGSFRTLYDKVIDVFGIDQVVVFEVSTNDALVVAARDRFIAENDNFRVECRQEVNEFGESANICNRILLNEQGEDENDSGDVFDTMYREDYRYHLTTSPCNENDKFTFSQEIAKLAQELNLTPRMTFMSLLSLNCDPFIAYGQIMEKYESGTATTTDTLAEERADDSPPRDSTPVVADDILEQIGKDENDDYEL